MDAAIPLVTTPHFLLLFHPGLQAFQADKEE